MNPVFFVGIFAMGALLWLLLSFLYKPIGSIGKRLMNDAKKAMFEDDKAEETNINNKEETKGE